MVCTLYLMDEPLKLQRNVEFVENVQPTSLQLPVVLDVVSRGRVYERVYKGGFLNLLVVLLAGVEGLAVIETDLPPGSVWKE